MKASSVATSDEGGFGGRRRDALDERDCLDVGSSLGNRFERLAVEAERGRDPEGIDRIGQQQHLDAAGTETFELRALTQGA